MPRGNNFLTRQAFDKAYGVFDAETRHGERLTADAVLRAILKDSRCWIVLRSILGMSASELASLATSSTSADTEAPEVDQKLTRELDSEARRGRPLLLESDSPKPSKQAARFDKAVRAMVPPLVDVLRDPRASAGEEKVHRLDKLDTATGLASLQNVLREGIVPYPDLLYERVLGRPYASHRDSVSGVVGNLIDLPLERAMVERGVPFYRTRPREAIPTLPQAPDFILPSREKPELIIENKLAEDDGTARDKVARIQALRKYEDDRALEGKQRREVVAIIDGRGFRHRRADLNKMLDACDGHVYTQAEIPLLFKDGGPLKRFVTKSAPARDPGREAEQAGETDDDQTGCDEER